ncbi:MAG TPA: hypothetical protein DIW31_09910 [Bacteroidales bacterium]|nr:hypothetical protein [Bacteroidales bacterium]
MAATFPTSNGEYERFFLEGNMSVLSTRRNIVLPALEKLKNSLDQEIGKTGMSLENFEKAMIARNLL